jgi:hypothetical protein
MAGRSSRLALRRAPRGKVLAVKWGYNPNSSSLGVDITFLLFGLSIITLLTPLVGFLLRWYRAVAPTAASRDSTTGAGPLGTSAAEPGTR